MKCFNPHCNNEVPEGWEGGMCPSCADQVEQIEQDDGDFDDAEEVDDFVDPYEEYGFDHKWELD